MRGLGTIINVAAVITGSVIGLFLKGGVPKKLEKTIITALGLAVCMIGLTGTLSEMLVISADGNISTQHILLLIISLAIGSAVGELIDIEKRLENIGTMFKKKFSFVADDNPRFVDGFVSASLLFCVGAMAIVGSISDGLTGDYSILATKSLLDFINAVIFSASMGAGVMLSAVAVGVYQGLITLLASLLQPFMSDTMVGQMTMIGSVLIMAIGINMITDKKLIKVGNMLPAVLIPVIYQIILNLFVKI